jgi:signal peptidase I
LAESRGLGDHAHGPELHCAQPGSGCLGSTSDRVLVDRLAYDFGSPQRGQIVVFKAPPKANLCQPGDAGETFVKRLIGLPGETVREDDSGFIWIRRGSPE